MQNAEESFGEWLKRRRDALGWNQRELARRAGVSQPTIHRLERGKTGIAGADAKTVTGISEALGVPIADTLTAAGVKIVAGLDSRVVEAAYVLQRLSPGHKEAGLAYIERLEAQEATGGAQGGNGGSGSEPGR